MKFKIEGSEFTIEEILYHISKGRSGHFKQLIIDALSTLERERDELRGNYQEVSGWYAKMKTRMLSAEAEIARRDAVAGEPTAWVCGDDEIRDFKSGREVTIVRDCDDSDLEYLPLYTAAPPAVLPPKYADELKDRAELIEAYSKTQCEIAQELGCDSDNESILKAIYELKELGAQQQKVVELYKRKSMEVISGQRYSYVLLDDLLPELDAAGVKWEVKK